MYIPKQIYFVRNNFFNFKYMQGFTLTKYTACSTTLLLPNRHLLDGDPKKLYPRQARIRFAKSYIWRSPPLGVIKLITYLICKTILVWFNTNYVIALFATFCGGKKLNKKLTKYSCLNIKTSLLLFINISESINCKN